MINFAQKSDIADIHKLGSKVEEFKVSEQTVWFWPQQVLEAAIDSPDVLMVVARDEAQKIGGFAIANFNQTLKKAIIENIYVTPENRGQNMASDILDFLLNAIKNRGGEYVATLVGPDDEAAAFYQKAGFAKGEQFLWLDITLTDKFKG